MTHSEYATLIFYWAVEPHPEKMDEMLSTLAESGWARTPQRALPMAGTVLALETLDPSRAPIWRQNYPELYRRIAASIENGRESQFWIDYLIAQWFVLRSDDVMWQILDRCGAWGEKDTYASRQLNQACRYHGPFRAAAERLKVVPVIEVLHPVVH